MLVKDDEVIISREEYETLLKDQRFLDALHSCGVDNWDGYEEAQDMIDDE